MAETTTGRRLTAPSDASEPDPTRVRSSRPTGGDGWEAAGARGVAASSSDDRRGARARSGEDGTCRNGSPSASTSRKTASTPLSAHFGRLRRFARRCLPRHPVRAPEGRPPHTRRPRGDRRLRDGRRHRIAAMTGSERRRLHRMALPRVRRSAERSIRAQEKERADLDHDIGDAVRGSPARAARPRIGRRRAGRLAVARRRTSRTRPPSIARRSPHRRAWHRSPDTPEPGRTAVPSVGKTHRAEGVVHDTRVAPRPVPKTFHLRGSSKTGKPKRPALPPSPDVSSSSSTPRSRPPHRSLSGERHGCPREGRRCRARQGTRRPEPWGAEIPRRSRPERSSRRPRFARAAPPETAGRRDEAPTNRMRLPRTPRPRDHPSPEIPIDSRIASRENK